MSDTILERDAFEATHARATSVDAGPPAPMVVTLGCRLNAYESDVARQHAQAAGLGDCIIVNTCAVTAEAVRKAEQCIRRLRRERPDARIIVTGCAAQIEPDRFAGMPDVDHVIGNPEKMQAQTFLELATHITERVQVNDIMSIQETAQHLLPAVDARTRGFVQVQNGCDHRCTFCIIPFGRGPSRSVPAGVVVNTIRQLVATGTHEVVLTGVDMTAYGRDLPGEQTLGRLVRQILKAVPELARLRLSSIDQVEVDGDLISAIADEPRLMPHLHLSLQAGCDMILKRMKRRHLRADAIRFATEVRRLRPDIVLGADLIAGFPTETDAMFAQTLNIVEACGLTYLHVFPYSPREGTPAARMPQVAAAVIKARARQLRALGQQRLLAHLDRQFGATATVLMERGGRGRTPDFSEVAIDGAAGQLINVRITGRQDTTLVGEALT